MATTHASRVRRLGVSGGIFLLLLLLAPISSPLESAPQIVVVPGRGIGAILLGMQEPEARKIIGANEPVEIAGNERILNWSSESVRIWVAADRVVRVRTTNPNHKTQSGFGPGDTNWDAARSAMCRTVSARYDSSSGFEIRCPTIGLTLEVSGDRIVSLSVFPAEGSAGPAPTAPQPAADKLIVPGDRIGQFRLSGKAADVHKTLGSPSQSEAGFWPDASTHKWTTAGFAIMVDDFTGNLLWMSMNGTSTSGPLAGAVTKEGIGLGSTEQQIVAALGRPSLVASDAKPLAAPQGSQGRTIYYHGRGISFTLASNGPKAGRVTFIDLFWALRATGDALVVPGLRIANVSVGMHAEQMMTLLGGGYSMVRNDTVTTVNDPSIGPIRVGNVRLGTFSVAWPHLALGASIENWHVSRIGARWSNSLEAAGVRYATTHGIGFNSTAQQVVSTLGQPSGRFSFAHREADDSEGWVYRSVGIAVALGRPSHYARPGRVVLIVVFPQ